MPLFAATTSSTAFATALDRLRAIPPEFWLRIGIIVLVLVGVVLTLRKLAQMNKVVLAVGVGLLATLVGFNWIYERNEPSWASPVVGWMAGFLPSKGKIEQKKAGL